MILRSLAVMVVALGALGVGARPLNVVFILADDLGQRDLGCYGSTYDETPNLDALAQSGVRFTDAYAACNVCSPSRAALLTGKYPARLHLTDWLPGRKETAKDRVVHPPIINHLPKGEVTVGQAFKEAGYATAFMGKWHLGGPAFYPEHFGFDVNVGGCQLGHPPSYFSPYKIPTPWSAMYYFKVDEPIVTQLSQATNITIRVLEVGKAGTIKTLFAVKLESDTRLKDFAAR